MRVHPQTVYTVCCFMLRTCIWLNGENFQINHLKVIRGTQWCFRVCVRNDATVIFYLLPPCLFCLQQEPVNVECNHSPYSAVCVLILKQVQQEGFGKCLVAYLYVQIGAGGGVLCAFLCLKSSYCY